MTPYTPTSRITDTELKRLEVTVFPNPTGDFFAVQIEGLLRETVDLRLFDLSGKLVQETTIQAGSTIGYLDARTLYAGTYLVSISIDEQVIASQKVVVE